MKEMKEKKWKLVAMMKMDEASGRWKTELLCDEEGNEEGRHKTRQCDQLVREILSIFEVLRKESFYWVPPIYIGAEPVYELNIYKNEESNEFEIKTNTGGQFLRIKKDEECEGCTLVSGWPEMIDMIFRDIIKIVW